MKKLYLISYYFAPLGRADGVNRTYLVKYLAEAGWDVEVISCENPHGFIRSFQKDLSLLDVIPPGVKLHRIKSTYWGPIGGIAELLGIIDDSFSNWIRPVLNAADTIIDQPGFIYAIVPPVTNAKIASDIAQQKGFPLVIDFRDDVFNLDPNIVRQADSIIASTQASLEGMQAHYQLSATKGVVIYNGYALERLPGTTTPQPKTKQLRIVYTGLLNMDQDPVMLAKAIQHMEQKYPHTKGKVVVDYYGPENFYTRLFLRKYLSDNIRFRGYVPFQTALAAIARADLAYTSLKNEGKAYCVPSKVFQYIAMETPILAVGPGGALQTFISQHQLGRYASSDDIDAQAEDIYYFLKNQQAHQEITRSIQQVKPQFAMQAQAHRLGEYLASSLEA
jgi:glycosyltransferase involved in cell wall biosynthesis